MLLVALASGSRQAELRIVSPLIPTSTNPGLPSGDIDRASSRLSFLADFRTRRDTGFNAGRLSNTLNSCGSSGIEPREVSRDWAFRGNHSGGRHSGVTRSGAPRGCNTRVRVKGSSLDLHCRTQPVWAWELKTISRSVGRCAYPWLEREVRGSMRGSTARSITPCIRVLKWRVPRDLVLMM